MEFRVGQGERHLGRFLEGVFAGMLGCVFLYTLQGLALVRVHGDLIACKMKLFLAYGMTPLVMPDAPELTGALHLLGSALFFGLTLGPLAALFCLPVALVMWVRGEGGKRADLILLAAAVVACLLSTYSSEVPVTSVVCAGAMVPLFFGPWTFSVRRKGGTSGQPWRVCLLACLFLLPLIFLKELSFTKIRDTMMDLPFLASVNDFYYEHTLLAAHVIKPLEHQSQKVIALSPEVEPCRGPGHGNLWLRGKDPCRAGPCALVVSGHPLPCEGLSLSGSDAGCFGRKMLQEASNRFDRNRRLRAGVRFFLNGPCLVIPVLLCLWVALGVEEGLRRRRLLFPVHAVLVYLVVVGPFLYQGLLLARAQTVAESGTVVNGLKSRHERYARLICCTDALDTDALILLTRDESPKVRLRSVVALGERKEERSFSTLSERLSDPVAMVRAKACYALGQLGTGEAETLLKRVLKEDPSWYVRTYAYNAYGRLSPEFRIVDLP